MLFRSPEIKAFKNCTVDAHLDQIRTVGEHFTWYNKRLEDPVYKALDKMLGNSVWFSTFTEARVSTLSRGIMDHCPLLLHVPMDVIRYPKPFQFFNYMLNLDGFSDVVKQAWDTSLFGDPMSILCRKLKLVKQALIDLNKKYGNLYTRVTTC